MPNPGEPKAEFFRDLLAYLRATRITGIAGGLVREAAGGTFLIPGNIPQRIGGGTVSAGYVPWAPNFFTEGSGESTVYKCRFNLGTMNQVAASNWNAEHTLGMAADAYHFVILSITTASGKVTGLTLSVDATAPSEDSLAKDTPPTSFKVVLGAIGRTEGKMIHTTNLEAVAAEVFRETKTAPAAGAEPFSRWWRWNVDVL